MLKRVPYRTEMCSTVSDNIINSMADTCTSLYQHKSSHTLSYYEVMYMYLMYFVWHIKGTASAVFGNIFSNTQHYAISNPGTLRASCPEVLFSLFFLTQVHVYVRLKRSPRVGLYITIATLYLCLSCLYNISIINFVCFETCLVFSVIFWAIVVNRIGLHVLLYCHNQLFHNMYTMTTAIRGTCA